MIGINRNPLTGKKTFQVWLQDNSGRYELVGDFATKKAAENMLKKELSKYIQ